MDQLGTRARLRAFVILGLMFALVLQLGYIIAFLFGQDVGLKAILIMIAVAICADFYAYFASDRIVLRLTNAQVVSRNEAPELHDLLDEMTIASGLPRPTLAIVQDAAPNAFATGRDPDHAAVAFTTGILQLLTRDELRAVMAHELAHIYNRDILVNSIGAVAVRLVGGLANALVYMGYAFLTTSSGGRRSKEAQQAEAAMKMLGLMMLLVGATLAITLLPALILLQFALSRSRESLADLTGVNFCKDPEALATGLAKISGDPTVSTITAQGISHFWISKPKTNSGGFGSWLANLYSTHPAPRERVDTLLAVSRGQSVDLAARTRAGSGAGISLLAVIAAALIAIPAFFLTQMSYGYLETPTQASDYQVDSEPNDEYTYEPEDSYPSEDTYGGETPYSDEDPYAYEEDVEDPYGYDEDVPSEDADGAIGDGTEIPDGTEENSSDADGEIGN